MAPIELSPRYDSKAVETGLYQDWEAKGYFRPASDFKNKPSAAGRYVIVIPPPNVTGILHIGHALNNTIQDILIRFNRMQGKDTLWIPGVDHAGIATQNVVEKKLAKEGKTRHQVGREKFLEEVWKWKESHGSTITRQLRRLGASCDWSRERFTMDEGLSQAVREAFVTLYERGLIYQGNYIINWCPRCQTALSDEESVHKEVQGGLYHIKYPIAVSPSLRGGRQADEATSEIASPSARNDGFNLTKVGEDHIVVATTRPETMLGDTAVAVNPNDSRYQHLIGKKLILPLLNREIPIIADEFVDQEFGTGMVKVTPAHDPNDFEMGRRHNLPQINVMHPDGRINENGGPYQGMDRFKARKQVIADLEALGLFVRRDSHLHAIGHCYRCESVVEPYLSKQWFVKMKPLAEKALKAHREGKTVFYPDRWTKVYTNWLEGIRDWCISRQIWWGHQIPVWYCDACLKSEIASSPKNEKAPRDDEKGAVMASSEGTKPSQQKGIIVSRETPEKCPACGSKNLRRDPDVLDTWFSSWLWPFSTLGWPASKTPAPALPAGKPQRTSDLEQFYPTSDLITAPEIIFFWVARMIMAGLEFAGEVPFSRIFIHGTVRAEGGLKMSKSLGNSIDPLEIIDEMGADALRHSMIMLSAQDVYLSREKFEVGRNFSNKLWNAARFALMNLGDFKSGSSSKVFDPKALPVSCRWILSRLEYVSRETAKQIGNFYLSQAATDLYHFVWNDFCDWFIEIAKPTLSAENTGADKKITQEVLYFTLANILKLLHPFMPFITETIWHKMLECAENPGLEPASLMIAPWPDLKGYRDEADETLFKLLQDAVSGIRDIRSRLNIAPGQQLEAAVVARDAKKNEFFKAFSGAVERLGRVSLAVDMHFKKSKAYIGNAFADFEVFVKIEGVIDPAKEKERVAKKIDELERYAGGIQKKLSNAKFVENAPAEVVAGERAKLEEGEKLLAAQRELLKLFQ